MKKVGPLEEHREKPPAFGVRHMLCFLIFWGLAFAYAMRVNLSVAIVAMTDGSANPDFTVFVWSEKVKSLLLSGFFWGYVVTQVPGGYLAHRFGGQMSLLAGVFLSSILSILTPLGTQMGNWPFLFAIRALQGLSQGVIFPSTHTLLAKWAPKEERAVLATYCYTGSQLGTVVMFAVSGIIASSSFGWPGIFYISGILGIIWTVVWYFWGSSSPSEHNSITGAERNLIEKSISNGVEKNENLPSDRHRKTPWVKFLTSPPFWALLIQHCTFSWGFWTLLTQIPSYLKHILGFQIKNNALLTSLPYLTMLVLSFVFSYLATLIERRKWLSITKNRKLFNTISGWIPALALVWLGYVDASQPKLAVVLLMVAVGFGAAINMGFMVNHIDLSPNFAGIMLGFTNMIANLMSIFAPLAVGFIITEEENQFQWRIVFFIAAGMFFFGGLLFLIYGSARVQPWNEPVPRTDAKAEEMQPMKSDSNKV